MSNVTRIHPWRGRERVRPSKDVYGRVAKNDRAIWLMCDYLRAWAGKETPCDHCPASFVEDGETWVHGCRAGAEEHIAVALAAMGDDL